MSLLANITGTQTLVFMGGALVGTGLFFFNRLLRNTALAKTRQAVLDEARRESDSILREARLAANEEALKIRADTEASFKERREEIERIEKTLIQREGDLNSRNQLIEEDRKKLEHLKQELAEKTAALEAGRNSLEADHTKIREQLARVAGVSQQEAKDLILHNAEEEAQMDANALTRRIMEEARTKAEEQARKTLAVAIQRYAGEYTYETTTATVTLPGDEIKGRIIGREGRNIRAFEAATGITVLIDDTPGAVVLSGFDPVRREIARQAMERLIADGRIHPTRIEEVVEKVQGEIDEHIREAGEEAVTRAGLPPLHPEVVKVLGRLKFRLSYSQNILDHSVEVAHICGLIAAELRIDISEAKRAGLLHDIGKAIHNDAEGGHAKVGAEFIQRFGLSPQVVNGVASHHDETEHIGPLGIIVSAADAISASRPGARSETLTTYLKRLENLERIGRSMEGIEKCYAVHAGRELRVMVQPDTVTDEQSYAIARRLCRKIEEELQYPGQIRVTVVRETRCIEYAK